jgi:hypothetical protein
MIKKLKHTHGITLLELMIATLLTGLVFAVAMSIYSSSIKFMSIQGAATDPTQSTVVVLEDIAKRISLCNEVSPITGGPQATIHLRCDYAVGSYTINNAAGNPAGTPSNLADDNYWHFGFAGGALRMTTTNWTTPVDDPSAGTIIIPNVNTGASSFNITLGSAVGNRETKVDIIVTTSVAPITEVRTSAILGARATR